MCNLFLVALELYCYVRFKTYAVLHIHMYILYGNNSRVPIVVVVLREGGCRHELIERNSGIDGSTRSGIQRQEKVVPVSSDLGQENRHTTPSRVLNMPSADEQLE